MMTQIYDPIIGSDSESGVVIEGKTKKPHEYDTTYVRRHGDVWLAFK